MSARKIAATPMQNASLHSIAHITAFARVCGLRLLLTQLRPHFCAPRRRLRPPLAALVPKLLEVALHRVGIDTFGHQISGVVRAVDLPKGYLSAPGDVLHPEVRHS